MNCSFIFRFTSQETLTEHREKVNVFENQLTQMQALKSELQVQKAEAEEKLAATCRLLEESHDENAQLKKSLEETRTAVENLNAELGTTSQAKDDQVQLLTSDKDQLSTANLHLKV